MPRKRILLLDDSEDVRRTLAACLNEAGYHIETVANVSEYLQLLRTHIFDYIILDLVLEGSPSIREVVSQLEAIYPEIGFQHDEIMKDISLVTEEPVSQDSPVNGAYLIPVTSRITSNTPLLVLTGIDIDTGNSSLFRRWGAKDTVPKLLSDEEFHQGSKEVKGLVDELKGILGKKEPPQPNRELPTLPRFESHLEELDGKNYTLKQFLKSHTNYWSPVFGVRGEILYYNAQQKILEQIAQVGFERTRSMMKVRPTDSSDFHGQGICVYAASAQKSVLVPDVSFDTRYAPVQETDTTRSELVVPLAIGKKLVGILNFEANVHSAFDMSHLDYFQRISHILALLIEHETYHSEERFLDKSLQAIAANHHPESILRTSLKSILVLMGIGTKGCVLRPRGWVGGERMLQVVVNEGLDLEEGETRKLDKFGIIRRALLEGKDEFYWSSKHGKEDYVPLAKGILSEYVKVIKVQNKILAVIDIESPAVAISERYRRAIGRLSANVASLVSGLKSKGDRGYKKACNAALEAASFDLHTVKNVLAVLDMEITRSCEPGKDAHLNYATRYLKRRFLDFEKSLKSFLEAPRSVALGPVLREVREFALAMQVALKVPSDVEHIKLFSARGSLKWLFENLVLNTRKHVRRRKKEAWIEFEEKERNGILTYWDNGQAPQSLEGFWEKAQDGQGLSIIRNLSQKFDWQCDVRRHQEGGLLFEFKLPNLSDSTFGSMPETFESLD